MAQTVEIITSEDAHPHAGWLQFVVTAKARGAINKYLKELARSDAQALGQRLLGNALRRHGHTLDSVGKTRWQHYLQESALTRESLLTQIGQGLRQAALVATALLEGHGETVPAAQDDDTTRQLEVHSAFESGISLAQCCYPLPQEPIIGQIVPGIGIHIHRQECPLRGIDGNEEWISATWAQERKGLFPAALEIEAYEHPRLLADVSSHIADADANITDFQMNHAAHDLHRRILTVWVEVRDREHLAQLTRRLRLLEDTIQIRRVERSQNP